MARPPRNKTVQAGRMVHKTWRGHNKEWNLESAQQKGRYAQYLNEDREDERYRDKQGSTLEAATLMSNHTHEALRIEEQKLFSDHMRRHHSRYGRYFNDLKKRCGKVAQDRPHTTLIEGVEHEMLCVFYIHANPHRAGFPDAERYEFSTHKLYAYGKRSEWMRNVEFPEWYMNLAPTMKGRQKRYRKLFAWYLKINGLIKKEFLKKYFYGSPLWMHERENDLREWRRAQRAGPAPS